MIIAVYGGHASGKTAQAMQIVSELNITGTCYVTDSDDVLRDWQAQKDIKCRVEFMSMWGLDKRKLSKNDCVVFEEVPYDYKEYCNYDWLSSVSHVILIGPHMYGLPADKVDLWILMKSSAYMASSFLTVIWNQLSFLVQNRIFYAHKQSWQEHLTSYNLYDPIYYMNQKLSDVDHPEEKLLNVMNSLWLHEDQVPLGDPRMNLVEF